METKEYCINISKNKKTGVAMLISDKLDLRAEKINSRRMILNIDKKDQLIRR